MDVSRIDDLGVLSLVNYGTKHAEKLEVHPNPAVSGRAPAVRGAVSQLSLTYAAYRPLRALWRQSTEKKDAANEGIDDFISGISYDLLAPGLLKGNRDAPEYRVLFPDGTIAFIHGPDRVEITQANAMAKYLEDHPQHPMAGRAAELRQKAAIFEATLNTQAAAESAYYQALAVQRTAKADLQRLLRKSVRFLRDIFDGVEAQVEALFATIAEARVPEDDDDEKKK